MGGKYEFIVHINPFMATVAESMYVLRCLIRLYRINVPEYESVHSFQYLNGIYFFKQLIIVSDLLLTTRKRECNNWFSLFNAAAIKGRYVFLLSYSRGFDPKIIPRHMYVSVCEVFLLMRQLVDVMCSVYSVLF